MKNLAIIPARSGSKGLKDKNIKELNGKPLMSYSIEAALKCKMFDEVMVSTDSKEYADIAVKLGGKVPFLRSDINSSDNADSWSAVLEVLDWYEAHGEIFDTVCLLQPTSPLRDYKDIISAYKIYEKRNASYVVSVCEVDYELFLCGALDDDGNMNGFIKRNGDKRRQEVKQQYRINGAIYIVRPDELRKDSYIYKDGCFAYIMSKEKSVDIDDMTDFEYAEYLIKRNSR